jgi:low temperature requirement protein LtrA
VVDYFNIGAETASRSIAHSSDPGRLARLAYTYLHLPLVAGIVVAAVADELVLAHPGGHAGIGVLAATLGSAALYLLGNALFKRTIYGRLPLSHLAGLALLVLLLMLTAAMPLWTPLALNLATTRSDRVAVWRRFRYGAASRLSNDRSRTGTRLTVFYMSSRAPPDVAAPG